MSNTTTTQTLTVTEKIIAALEELREIHGTEYLTYEVVRASDRHWVRCKLNALEQSGHITIERHIGRGQKNIIRKNRNSPGLPRRRTR